MSDQPTRPGRPTKVPPISRPLLHFFRGIVRGQFRRRFHAVRLAGGERLREVDGPVMVYANHIGWWDPMVAFLLAKATMPERRHYAPMDAEALARYPILSKLGIFPVAMNAARGGVQFLRTGEAVLRSGGVLWVTPQGRFADVRERPLVFKPGMAALAARVGRCTVVPLASEYAFWSERSPEALLLLGEPVVVVVADGQDAGALEQELVSALERTMEEMAQRSMGRRPESFPEVLLRGSAGVGGFYAIGQRLRAWVRGRRYRPEHALGETSGRVAAGRGQ